MKWIYIDFLQILILSVITISTTQNETSNDTQDELGFRLTPNVYPLDYKLVLDVREVLNNGNIHFQANLNITLMATDKKQRTIVLNTKNLKVHPGWRLYRQNQFLIPSNGPFRPDDKMERVSIPFSKNLDAGIDYTLMLEYEGIINEKELRGIYRNVYNDGKNVTILTNLFPIQCRKLFPCFDEPRFRATFELEIHNVPDRFRVISNGMSQTVENIETGLSNYIFDPTHKISPHNFGFIIFEFGHLVSKIGDFNFYGQPGTENQYDFAMDVIKKGEKHFSDWIGYPLDLVFNASIGMDIIGVPNLEKDLIATHAMIFTKESHLLYKPYETTTVTTQLIVKNIIHQLVYQWFGSVLTIDYWDEVWLIDGFTEYFTYKITNEIKNDFHFPEQFAVNVLHKALAIDSGDDSVVMVYEKLSVPADVLKIADSKLYGYKGAALLRWIEHILGKKQFQEKMQTYFLENTNHDELVTTLEFLEYLNTNFEETDTQTVFTSWFTQPGYPLVSAKLENSKLILSQEPFYLKKEKNENPVYWKIPITIQVVFTDSAKNDQLFLLKVFPDQPNMEIDLPSESIDFYLINVDQIGFYRVNYDENNWQKINDTLNEDFSNKTSTPSRVQIVNDLFNLAHAGYLKYDFLLDMLVFLKKETEYVVWKAAFDGFEHLYHKIPEDNANEFHQGLKKYVRLELKNLYKKMGYLPKTNEDQLHLLLRTDLLDWECKSGNNHCIKNSLKTFDDHFSKRKSIHPDLRRTVYCTVARSNDEERWNLLWKKYQKENFSSEQQLILQGLGCIKNETLINEYLDIMVSSKVIKQDNFMAFTYIVTGNIENIIATFDYIQNNWQTWIEIMNIEDTLRYLAERFSTKTQVKELQDFLLVLLENKAVTENQVDHIQKSIDLANYNLDWNKRRLKEFWPYYETLPDEIDDENIDDIYVPEKENSIEVSQTYWIIIISTAIILASLVIILGVSIILKENKKFRKKMYISPKNTDKKK